MTKTKKVITKRSWLEKTVFLFKYPIVAAQKRIKSFLSRRPHRSFRLTKRRDYKRSLNIEGYFAFTLYVWKTLWANKRIFIWAGLFYALLSGILVGMSSQDAYSTLTDTIDEAKDSIVSGGISEIGRAGLVFLATITGGTSSTLTEVQQFWAGFIFLLSWLSTVWLLRNILAGHKVKFRDGLYNSASPFVSTFLVFILIIVQLLPIAMAMIGYSAAQSSGLLAGGVEAMLFWIAAILLASLSLYWISGTFIALIVVTLPGMYPFEAIKTAGDMVTGRRIRILLRLVWMALSTLVVWAIIVIPIIMLDSWIKSIWSDISWLPTIPFVVLIMSSFTIVWISSYVYLLYRKVIADESAPA